MKRNEVWKNERKETTENHFELIDVFDDYSFITILVTKMKTNLLHSDRQTKTIHVDNFHNEKRKKNTIFEKHFFLWLTFNQSE